MVPGRAVSSYHNDGGGGRGCGEAAVRKGERVRNEEWGMRDGGISISLW